MPCKPGVSGSIPSFQETLLVEPSDAPVIKYKQNHKSSMRGTGYCPASIYNPLTLCLHAVVFQNQHFRKIPFWEYHQDVKQFGPRS